MPPRLSPFRPLTRLSFSPPPFPLTLSSSPYHTPSYPLVNPYPPTETHILSSALTHVPLHGFTLHSLTLGAQSAGYLPITTNLFPRGAFELVRYHLITSRLSLASRLPPLAPTSPLVDRVRAVIFARLLANAETPTLSPTNKTEEIDDGAAHHQRISGEQGKGQGVLPHWQQALGIMSLGENIAASVKELAELSDEILYLARDEAMDGGWYARRAGVGAVYAAAEMYQTGDRSEGFRETEEFVGRRLREVWGLGNGVGGVLGWVGFQGGAVVNLLRSKGVRI